MRNPVYGNNLSENQFFFLTNLRNTNAICFHFSVSEIFYWGKHTTVYLSSNSSLISLLMWRKCLIPKAVAWKVNLFHQGKDKRSFNDEPTLQKGIATYYKRSVLGKCNRMVYVFIILFLRACVNQHRVVHKINLILYVSKKANYQAR